MKEQKVHFSFDDLVSSLNVESNQTEGKEEGLLKEIFSDGEKNAREALKGLDQISKEKLDKINQLVQIMFLDNKNRKNKDDFYAKEKRIIYILTILMSLKVITDDLFFFLLICAWAVIFFIPVGFSSVILFAICLKIGSKVVNFLLRKALAYQKKIKQELIDKLIIELGHDILEIDFPLAQLVYNAFKTNNRSKNTLLKENLKKVFKQWEVFTKADTIISITSAWEYREDFSSMQMLRLREIIEARNNKTNLTHSLEFLFAMIKDEVNKNVR